MILLSFGDHILADRNPYCCTFSLFEETLQRFGIEADFIDALVLDSVSKALKPNTKTVYSESPTNLTLKVIDIEKVAKEVHYYPTKSGEKILVVLDNNFYSLIITKGLNFGADIVIQSMTKYINRHIDVIGGIVFCHNKEMINAPFIQP